MRNISHPLGTVYSPLDRSCRLQKPPPQIRDREGTIEGTTLLSCRTGVSSFSALPIPLSNTRCLKDLGLYFLVPACKHTWWGGEGERERKSPPHTPNL